MDGGARWAAVHGVAKSRTRLSNFTFTFHFSLSCIGEGNGNPLQCSSLENPRDGGAWWAAVSGVTQSRTRLKWLSSSSSSNTMRQGFQILIYHFIYLFIFIFKCYFIFKLYIIVLVLPNIILKKKQILTTSVNILHLLSCRVRI